MTMSKQIIKILFSLILIFTILIPGGCNPAGEPVGETDPSEGENSAEVEEYQSEIINDDFVLMLPPTAFNLNVSPEGDYIFFHMAAAPIEPCHIISTETYTSEESGDPGVSWGKFEALPTPGMEGGQTYFSDISADGDKLLYIAYEFEGFDPFENATINFSNLKLPPDVYHQVNLDKEEVINGIRPVWKANQEGIYYLTAQGIMSYNLTSEQVKHLYEAADLEGLIQNNQLAPHAFNLSDNYTELAYYYEEKIYFIPLEEESDIEVIETGVADIANIEFIFNGKYLSLESADTFDSKGHWLTFIDRQTGEMLVLENNYQPAGYAINNQEQMVFVEDRGGRNFEYVLLNSSFDKVGIAAIPDDYFRFEVIWLGDKWCALKHEQEGTPLYQLDF